jgi:hypothetical protein
MGSGIEGDASTTWQLGDGGSAMVSEEAPNSYSDDKDGLHQQGLACPIQPYQLPRPRLSYPD